MPFFSTALPRDAFSGMSELESLNLEHTGLTTIALESPTASADGTEEAAVIDDDGAIGRGRLNELRLLGNPLKCDCHARWVLNSAFLKPLSN